jgi:hypothetical protein
MERQKRNARFPQEPFLSVRSSFSRPYSTSLATSQHEMTPIPKTRYTVHLTHLSRRTAIVADLPTRYNGS